MLNAVPDVAIAKSVEELFQQGNAAQTAGQYAEAETIWRQVLRSDRLNAAAYSNLGLALYEQKKLEEAIRAYREAINLDPKSANAYYDLGLALYEQKKLEEAIRAYREAINLNPKSANAYNGLGNALYEQKKLEEAIRAYREAINLDPKSANAYNGLGNALYEQKKLEEAIRAYREAINLDPKSTNAYYNLGVALHGQKDLEEMIRAYREAINLDPKSANAYYNLGVALYEQKKLEEAIRAYREVLSLPEDTSGIPINFHTAARNGLGLVFLQQGKLTEAIAEFRQAVKTDPNYSFSQNNLKEAQRQLALQGSTQTLALTETRYLPEDSKTPLRRAVVKVVATFLGTARGASYGTGCIIKKQGNTALVLTNRHVVLEPDSGQQGENLQIEFYFGDNLPERAIPPRIGERGLGTVRILRMTALNDPLDLALLEIKGLPPDINPLPIASNAKEVSNVLVIGNPGGNWSTDKGKILDANDDTLTLKVKLDGGNSGSPVLVNNQMAGLVFKAYITEGDQKMGTGYAYPMPRIMKQLNKWGIRL